MSNSITKEEVAILQLCDAIELFKKKRYVSSITLAGAAEEVLAQLLKQHVVKTGIPFSTAEEFEADLFDMFKEFLGIGNYRSERNKIKNELKHHGKKNENILTGDFRQIVLTHIAGGIQNFRTINNNIPKEQIINDFCLEIGIS